MYMWLFVFSLFCFNWKNWKFYLFPVESHVIIPCVYMTYCILCMFSKNNKKNYNNYIYIYKYIYTDNLKSVKLDAGCNFLLITCLGHFSANICLQPNVIKGKNLYESYLVMCSIAFLIAWFWQYYVNKRSGVLLYVCEY